MSDKVSDKVNCQIKCQIKLSDKVTFSDKVKERAYFGALFGIPHSDLTVPRRNWPQDHFRTVRRVGASRGSHTSSGTRVCTLCRRYTTQRPTRAPCPW